MFKMDKNVYCKICDCYIINTKQIKKTHNESIKHKTNETLTKIHKAPSKIIFETDLSNYEPLKFLYQGEIFTSDKYRYNKNKKSLINVSDRIVKIKSTEMRQFYFISYPEKMNLYVDEILN